MLIVGPKAKGHSPGEPASAPGAPEPSKGALNAKTPPSAPISQYPGSGLLGRTGFAAPEAASAMKHVAAAKATPAAMIFATTIARHLLLGWHEW
jgi:hypothetical protein